MHSFALNEKHAGSLSNCRELRLTDVGQHGCSSAGSPTRGAYSSLWLGVRGNPPQASRTDDLSDENDKPVWNGDRLSQYDVAT